MRKLRLIKPWRLRTVRQKTAGIEDIRNTVELSVPCNAPGSSVFQEEQSFRTGLVDIRTGNKVLAGFLLANFAPCSDVAYALKCNAKR